MTQGHGAWRRGYGTGREYDTEAQGTGARVAEKDCMPIDRSVEGMGSWIGEEEGVQLSDGFAVWIQIHRVRHATGGRHACSESWGKRGNEAPGCGRDGCSEDGRLLRNGPLQALQALMHGGCRREGTGASAATACRRRAPHAGQRQRRGWQRSLLGRLERPQRSGWGLQGCSPCAAERGPARVQSSGCPHWLQAGKAGWEGGVTTAAAPCGPPRVRHRSCKCKCRWAPAPSTVGSTAQYQLNCPTAAHLHSWRGGARRGGDAARHPERGCLQQGGTGTLVSMQRVTAGR